MRNLEKSRALYERNKQVLAGASTFGKSVDQFAYGITPFALERGDGAYVWDSDGNKYLDTMMSLGCVTLGYNHPYVNEAIQKQLSKGIAFSLTHSLEIEVAEMLCERIPCAELVRFGKNGNDVTTAAVRLSRYITGKEHVLFCGYHGWQDWYICQTSMNGGIPAAIKEFSHRFPYNNLKALEELLIELRGKAACIIMEAVSKESPHEGYLEGVRKLADEHGVILVFDEVVTGFRFHRGGYQAVCGVTPDLATFSKALGNGMPISALVGKKEFMEKCPEIFFSLTSAGETLSLAAAKAVMEFMDKENVFENIARNGQRFLDGFQKHINENSLSDVVSYIGFPCRSIVLFKDADTAPSADIRTYWIQELAKKGILTAAYQIISHSHQKEEIQFLLNAYNDTLNDIKISLLDGTLPSKLQCPSAKESARSL